MLCSWRLYPETGISSPLAHYDLSLEMSQSCLPAREKHIYVCVCVSDFSLSLSKLQWKLTKWTNPRFEQWLKCFHSALFVNILDEMYWKSMKISRWCGSLPYFHMLWVHPWELAAPFSKLSCHMELICYSNHRQIFNISDIMTFSIFLLNTFSNFCH